MYPSVISKKDSSELPFLQIVLIKETLKDYGLDFYKYFTLLLQEVTIDIEEEFLIRLLDFFKIETDEKSVPNIFSEDETLMSIESGKQLYFESFQIQPVKVNFSFSASGSSKKKERESQNILKYFLNVLTSAVGNVTDAPIKLNALFLNHLISTHSLLKELIITNYSQQILGQIYSFLGSADVLGNPVGLFNSISSGVYDVFYEPYMGFVSDRPQDIGIGLAKGTASLVKKTVYGIGNTFSKFSGALGKGLAIATMDSDFERKRNRRSKNRPRNTRKGVATGASSLAQSIVSGVTGIVEQPLKGATTEGIGGFIKGVGKGAVGFFTKPMVGIMDLATNVSEGIKGSATDEIPIDVVRPPRYISSTDVLRNFNLDEAMGALFFNAVNNTEFSDDSYICHLNYSDKAIILSEQRIMMVETDPILLCWSVNIKGKQQSKYRYTFS